MLATIAGNSKETPNSFIHVQSHTHTSTHIAYIHTHLHTHTHTHAHTHTHMYIHIHTHVYTHPHRQCVWLWGVVFSTVQVQTLLFTPGTWTLWRRLALSRYERTESDFHHTHVLKKSILVPDLYSIWVLKFRGLKG